MPAGPYPTQAQFLEQKARIDNLEQTSGGGGGGGYSETLVFGNTDPASPTGDVLPTRGLEFEASVTGTVNAIRFWARLAPSSPRPSWQLDAQLIINDAFKASVPVRLTRGRWAELTVRIPERTITGGDRVGVVLQSPQELPELLGRYVEAGNENRALGYGQLNGYIDGLSVSAPITYQRTPHANTGETYPVLHLLQVTGIPDLLPHDRFRQVTGTGDVWNLVDARMADQGLPAVEAVLDGQSYRAVLWPDDPTGVDPTGAYVPWLPTIAAVGARRMAWVDGQLIVRDPYGTAYIATLTPAE